jgi:hypothetical protein
MHDCIDGERQPEADHFGGEAALARIAPAVSGDVVGGGRLAVLDRDLHVVEAGFGQDGEGARGEPNA